MMFCKNNPNKQFATLALLDKALQINVVIIKCT